MGSPRVYLNRISVQIPPRTLPRCRVQGECPPHHFQFNIWLVYNDNETPMGILDTMPLQLIFAYAHEWVTQDLGADIHEDMMRLVLEPDTMLANTGYVFEVPILADQIIENQEETVFFL
jgi:hypothetical protein